MYQLVFQPNTQSSLSVALGSPLLSVGRDEINDVIIHDSAVSAFHARFQVEDDGGLFVEDQDSSNGTQLNGRLIRRERLESGDVILIAGVVEVLVVEQTRFEGLSLQAQAALGELAESVRALSGRK